MMQAEMPITEYTTRTVVTEEAYSPQAVAAAPMGMAAPVYADAPYASVAPAPYVTESYMAESYGVPPMATPAYTTTEYIYQDQPMMGYSDMTTIVGPVNPPPITTTTTTYTIDPLYNQSTMVGGMPMGMTNQQKHRPGRLKVVVTEGTDFGKKHKHPYVLLTVGSQTTHTHATKTDRQRHVSWNEMAEFDIQDASTEILRVSIAEKHRFRHDEKFAASRPIPLNQLPYNAPRSFTADTGLGRVNLQLELLPPPGMNNSHMNAGLDNIFGHSMTSETGYTLTQNHRYTTV